MTANTSEPGGKLRNEHERGHARIGCQGRGFISIRVLVHDVIQSYCLTMALETGKDNMGGKHQPGQTQVHSVGFHSERGWVSQDLHRLKFGIHCFSRQAFRATAADDVNNVDWRPVEELWTMN